MKGAESAESSTKPGLGLVSSPDGQTERVTQKDAAVSKVDIVVSWNRAEILKTLSECISYHCFFFSETK